MTVDRDLADRMPVYLDYAATTPVDPAVAKEMFACLTEGGDFGNASSATHVFGQRAAARVEIARARQNVSNGCVYHCSIGQPQL